jgi:hypothetical protein
MVYAATSINLPMKFEFPIFWDGSPLKPCMFLGLGDLVLPGLFLKFCKRVDFINKKRVYYKASLILYTFALFTSGFAVFIYKSAQPVLFYMSPILLIGTLLLALVRKEVNIIWNADTIEDTLNTVNIGSSIESVDLETGSLNQH